MLFRYHILAASIAINIAISVPTIDYPLNSQVPQIARVSNTFSYTFPKSTFSSPLPITYQLSGPKWLTLDSETRKLSGTPSEQDVGTDTLTNVAISLTASDSSGATTLNATLIVSKNPAPTINIPLSSQLPSFGTFSVPSTLSYHPTTPFNFSFDPDTFSNDGKSKLNYYAVTSDHTPMPSWVKFEATTLTFSGQTPDYASLIQPPQTFGITLIASDVEGYAGSSITVEITVGPHQLSFSNTTMSFNATGGNTVNFTGLANNLQLDGQNVNSTTITKFTVDTPSWLSFANSTMTISGKAPPDVVPQNITVHAEDIYGDSANATILLQVEDSIFSKEIPDLNATVGSDFRYDLSSYLRSLSEIDVAFKSKPSQPWIQLDFSKIILSGKVPDTMKPGDIEISIKATSKASGASETQTFKFSVAAQIKPSATTAKSTEATSTTKPTQTAIETPLETSAGRKLNRGAFLAIAITIPLIVAVFVLLALFLLCRKRRRDAKKRPASITKSDISAPIESHSSVEEIILPPPVAAPLPLELDTSTFHAAISTHGLTTNEKHESWRYIPKKSSPPQDRRVRKSQTISGDGLERRSQVMSGGIGAADITLGEAKTTGNRGRSYSENALSKTDSSWRSTQESASHPTLRFSQTNSSQLLGVARTYSNYSRKGHKRRSARVLDTIIIRDPEESTPNITILANSSPPQSQPSQPPHYLDTIDTVKRESSILGLTGSDIYATPLDNFSALGPKKSVSPQPPDVVYIPQGINNSRISSRTDRRQTRMFLGFEGSRRSGNGHGVNRSISSLSSKSTKRRSIGHGQVWTTNTNLNHSLGQNPSLARNSRTWKTVATSSNQTERPPSGVSGVSALSEYSETYPASPAIRSAMHMGIRQVTMSPELQESTFQRPSKSSSRNSRPVSRRIGSSPFFGGGSMRSSNRDSRLARTRTSYVDSPTVPEEPLIFSSFENTIHHPDPPRDSFGISYGMARESTRQLRSYIQGQGFGTRGSVRSESRDSRFESANESLRSPTKEEISSPARQEREDSYEDFLPEDYSDGSWETQADSRNDLANVTILGGTESELGDEQHQEPESDLTAIMGWSGRANLVPGEGSRTEGSRSAEKSKSYAPERGRGRDVGGGLGPRIFKGARRRPISVDAATHGGLKGSVRGRIEGDETGGGGESEWGAFI